MKKFLPISSLLPVCFLSLCFFVFTNGTTEDAVAKQNAITDYKTNYLATEISAADSLGWTGNVKSCKPGTLSASTYTKMLQRINYFRRLAGVDDHVYFDLQWNQYAQAAALIMCANDQLNHDPDNSMKCFSNDGKLGASTSNLSSVIDLSIKDLIADQMQDGSSVNNFCGHRRWLLNADAFKMGFGATPTAYAVRVFESNDEETNDTSSFHGIIPDYYAYPFKGYVPYQVVYPKWSFSIAKGTPDFGAATVSVTSGDKVFSVSVVNRAKFGYGDPTLVWTVTGLKENFEYNYYDMAEKKKGFATLGILDKKILVKIGNVKVDGVVKNYSYTFTIFDPME